MHNSRAHAEVCPHFGNHTVYINILRLSLTFAAKGVDLPLHHRACELSISDAELSHEFKRSIRSPGPSGILIFVLSITEPVIAGSFPLAARRIKSSTRASCETASNAIVRPFTLRSTSTTFPLTASVVCRKRAVTLLR